MSNRSRVQRPRHDNKTTWQHNPHSKKTEKILASPNEGVCQNCWEQIEWRKKFRKYKPLTVPRRCDCCKQKTIKIAYHTLCQSCATEKGTCAKCTKEAMTHPYVVLGSASKKDEEREAIAKMTERQRRTYLRELEREAGGGKKKKSEDDADSFSEGDLSDDDDMQSMPKPPASKYDPDMLLKERAAREGRTFVKNEESGEEDEEDEEDQDGSAESYEEDSEELDLVDKEAEKLVGRKDPVIEEDISDAGSDEELEEDDE